MSTESDADGDDLDRVDAVDGELASVEWTPPQVWGEEKTILGNEYLPDTLRPTITAGGSVFQSADDNGVRYAGSTVRREFERAAINKEQPIWIGYEGGDKADLRAREVGIPFESFFNHLFLSGGTGSGKTTVLENILTQLAWGGWGFCYVDPGGDADEGIMARIPEHRLDDVIWIEPPAGNYEYNISLNFLEVDRESIDSESEYDALVTNIVDELKSIIAGDEELYSRMGRVLDAVLPAMIRAEEPYTLLDVYQFLSDEQLQQEFKTEVEDDVLRSGVKRVADDLEAMDIEPVEGRFSKWVMPVTPRKVVANKKSTININQAVEEGKILIVNPSPGPVSDEVGRIISSAIVQRVWATAQSRTSQRRDERRPFFLVIDELHSALTNSTDLEGMINEARKYKLGLILATQYPSQLPEDRRNAVLNAGQILALNTDEEDDGRELMNRMGEYDAGDLAALDYWKTFMKVPLGNGEESAPIVCNNFAQYPPLRSQQDVHDIIEESVRRHGSPDKKPNTEGTVIKQHLGGGGSVAIESDTAGGVSVQDIELDTILKSIHAVEIREESTQSAQYVSVDAVREELSRRVGELGYISKLASVITEQLPESLVDVDIISGSTQVSLTTEGRDRARKQDTGSSGGGGGLKHRLILQSTHDALTKMGCSVDLPDQDGDQNLPDAVATLPIETSPGVGDILSMDTSTEIDATDLGLDPGSSTIDLSSLSSDQLNALRGAVERYEETLPERMDEIDPMLSRVSGCRKIAVEAETTSISRPGQTLRNLSQVAADGRTCLFTVPDGSESDDDGVSSFEGWGLKAARILTNPPYYREMESIGDGDGYKRVLYAGDGQLEHDGQSVLRPTDAAHATSWAQYRDGEGRTPTTTEWGVDANDTFVLENRSGETILTLTADDIQTGISDITQLPAWGGYDHNRQEFVVYTPNPDGSVSTTTYDDKAAFKGDWRKVSTPFIPETEFDIDTTDLTTIHDYWRILIIPDEDNPTYDEPQLFTVDQNSSTGIEYTLTPLHSGVPDTGASDSYNPSNTGGTGDAGGTDKTGGVDRGGSNSGDELGVDADDQNTDEDDDVLEGIFGGDTDSSDSGSTDTQEPLTFDTEGVSSDEGDSVFAEFEDNTDGVADADADAKGTPLPGKENETSQPPEQENEEETEENETTPAQSDDVGEEEPDEPSISGEKDLDFGGVSVPGAEETPEDVDGEMEAESEVEETDEDDDDGSSGFVSIESGIDSDDEEDTPEQNGEDEDDDADEYESIF